MTVELIANKSDSPYFTLRYVQIRLPHSAERPTQWNRVTPRHPDFLPGLGRFDLKKGLTKVYSSWGLTPLPGSSGTDHQDLLADVAS